ncbi:hypothetical protein HDV01_005766 [Terramyces sp. JEL0728]|nr:hypothetical protein HDV01_005766 [Terramyces sp. JEL0728]
MFLGLQLLNPVLKPAKFTQFRSLSSQFKSKREKSFFRQESLANEPVVEQFVKYIMKDGMKARAQRIINTSLELISLKTKENPRAVLEKAIDQIAPYVASQKRGARNVLLPKPLTPRQRKRIGIQWISDQASSRKGNLDFGARIGQESAFSKERKCSQTSGCQ